MVSRAVQRKKERREKVKAALGNEAPEDGLGGRRRRAPTPPWHVEEEGHDGDEGNGEYEGNDYEGDDYVQEVVVPTPKPAKEQPVEKKPRVELVAAAPVAPPKPVVSIEASVRERLAAEGKLADDGTAEALSRKEKRRLETAKKLDKTVEKMQKMEARMVELEAKAKAEVGGDEDAAQAKLANMREAKERHAARHIGGTFWRTRKERKAKTLFVGNVPLGFDQFALKSVIEAVLRENDVNVTVHREGAAEVLSSKEAIDFDESIDADAVGWGTGTAAIQSKGGNKPFSSDPTEDPFAGLYGDECPVLTIDFLKTMKQKAKTHHAYVCFRTYEIAMAAQSLLDGMPLSDYDRPDNNKLRVNFSEDTSARATAISKREGSKHLRGGVQPAGRGRGFGGGRGGRGGGRGFGGGGGRGGGRGGGFRGGRGGGGGFRGSFPRGGRGGV